MMAAHYKYLAFFAGVLSFAGFILIIQGHDPDSAPTGVKLIFFSSLFFAVWGFSSIGFSFFERTNPLAAYRRGFLFSLFFLILALAGRKFHVSAVSAILTAGFLSGLEVAWTFFYGKSSRFDDAT